MLHLLFASLADDAVLKRFAQGDDVVFLENASFALLKNSRFAASLEQFTDCQLYALADDLAARGLMADGLIANLKVINYDDLVALTVNNPHTHSWS